MLPASFSWPLSGKLLLSGTICSVWCFKVLLFKGGCLWLGSGYPGVISLLFPWLPDVSLGVKVIFLFFVSMLCHIDLLLCLGNSKCSESSHKNQLGLSGCNSVVLAGLLWSCWKCHRDSQRTGSVSCTCSNVTVKPTGK